MSLLFSALTYTTSNIIKSRFNIWHVDSVGLSAVSRGQIEYSLSQSRRDNATNIKVDLCDWTQPPLAPDSSCLPLNLHIKNESSAAFTGSQHLKAPNASAWVLM